MKLTVSNKNNFLSYFFNPISRLSNNCVVDVGEKEISTIIAAADNTAILYARYKSELGAAGTKVNLPDIGRLVKILQCINKDTFNLSLDNNCLKYKDNDIQFKYHLLEDGILAAPAISIEKIGKLTFNTNFKVPYSSIVNLIKGSTFAINLNKLYIFTKDNCVYAEINDKQSHNVDSVCVKLCDKYEGESIETPLPLSFETVRVIIGAKCDYIKINVNTQLNVMTFDINNNESHLTYIVSGLIK